MDKTIRDDYQISSLKKSFKKGKTEIINKYVKKIHHLQNQKGDASKVSKCQRRAEKLKEEVAVLQKIKPRDMCKMTVSKDKDWKNVLSQDGVSLEDRCHALIANHSAVQAALEKLHSKSRCPTLSDEISTAERQASKAKKKQKRRKSEKENQQEKEKSETESVCFKGSGSEKSEKENCESCKKRSSSSIVLSVETPPKRPHLVSEEGTNLESSYETRRVKPKKTSKKDQLLGVEKDEKQSLKKENPPRIKKEKHLGEEIPEMQDEDENTSFPPTETCIVKAKRRKKKRKSSEKEENDLMSCELPGMTDNLNTNFPPTERCIVKAKKRKKKRKSSEREENDLMSSRPPGMTDYLKDQEDDSGGSEKENRSSSFSSGIAPKRSHVVHKDSESDENLELLCQAKSKKRKVSIIDYQLREEPLEKEKTKKQCLVEEKLSERPELQNSTMDKLHECPASPDRTSEINDKESESSNHLESQQQTVPSKRKKTSKKEDQLEEENTQVQCFEEKLPRKKRKTVLNENQLIEERDEIKDLSLNELPEIMQFSKDENEGSNSEGLGKKGQETSRKRKPSVSDRSNKVTKKICKGSEVEKDSELRDSIPKKPKQKKLLDQAKQFTPDNLIELMYQLDLSILCSLRKSMNEQLYPSLTLTFGDPEISKFSDIVIRHQEKSVHICVESADSFIPSNIGYSRLFNREKISCSLNSYFGSFVKHVISKSDALHSVDYLIIYTNAGLDLTEENELKRGLLKNFYPFRFESINVEDHDVIKTFLYTRNTFHKFYQFSQDKTTRKELLKQLKISPTMQKSLGKNFPSGFEKEIKEAFLDKLVFAVDQPNREELNCIVRTELKQKRENSYMKLQKKILSKLEKHGQNVSGIIYEFYAYVLFLHDVFLQKNMLSLKIEGGSSDAPLGVTIDYKGRTSYMMAHHAEGDIGYGHLFSSKPKNSGISIDRLFTLFVQKSKDSLRYFIIYTNGDLELNEEMELESKCKDFYPLKFDNVDIQKKKYKFFRNCSCIQENGFYQFSKEEKTRQKLVSLLNLPPTLEEATELNNKEMKELFLDKLIFVVNQPNWKKLNHLVIEKLDYQSDNLCNSDELFEVALRWLESYDTSPLRKGSIEKILDDVRNNILSYQDFQNTDIAEIYRFAKVVVGRGRTFWFRQFFRFLLKGEGRQCLGVLKKEGIKLSTVSTLLQASGSMACKSFLDFYDCLFDKEGNKTHYMKNLEGAGLYICTLSSILTNARANAALAFKDLYDLLFDCDGKKTKYLRNILENGIDLVCMCSFLRGTGTAAAKAFKDLYDLWIDSKGKKMQWLETLEKEGITLSILFRILSGAGDRVSKAFKELYGVWFDEKGNKKECLNVIQKEGISVSMASFLNRSGCNAAQAFTDLYNLWFGEHGKKEQCLKTLELEGITLSNLNSILKSPGFRSAEAFDSFYCLLFDKQGNKTLYLKALQKEKIKFSNISNMLTGSGKKACKAFNDLWNLWFDKQGNKKPCLKYLRLNGMNVSDVSSILNRAGSNASKAFKELYDLWFDEHGNKKPCLKILEKKGIKLSNLASFMVGAQSNASEIFNSLFNLWFNEKGRRTQYLKTLEKEGINLDCVSSIIRGSGTAVSKAYKELYNVWFDKHGNKTFYLKTIEKEGIRLSSVSGILKGAGPKAAKTFKNLYYLWFDVEGNKTNYLKTLEKKGVRLSNVSSILCGAGHKALKAFKDLYYLWFNKKGKRTQYLRNLKKEGMSLSNVSSILNGAGSNAPKAFKELYHLWFDDHGRETQFLKTLAANGVNLSHVSCILSAAGSKASKAFKELYTLCFDEQGKKTKYVTDLEEQGMSISDVSGILKGAGSSAAKAFKNFCESYFDEKK